MSFGWKKIAAHVWRLDETYQVVESAPGQWVVYQGRVPQETQHATAAAAMDEAERLQRESK